MQQQQKSATGKPIPNEELWASISAERQVEKPASRIPTEATEVHELDEVIAPATQSEQAAPTETGTPTPIRFPKKTVLAESISASIQNESHVSAIAGASTHLAVVESSVSSNITELVAKQARFPHNLPQTTGLFLGQNGKAYFVMKDAANSYVVAVGSKKANNLIRKLGQPEGITLRKSDLNDINHILQAEAESAGNNKCVWYRVAPIQDGIMIDLGDDKHTYARVTPGMVDLVTKGCDTLFYRTQVSKPMVMPANAGDLGLLKKYLNLHPVQVMLFIAWISYTLAHPKISTSKFLILVLSGNQGSGKSFLCWIILMLIDPSIIGVQILPSNSKDLSIAAQNAHVLCYDNLRELSQSMSDILCTAATGGSISNRQLYSDADQNVLQLHVALVLNGIHAFVDQPDLAQRCLPLTLLPFNESKRKSEAQLTREFEADLPAIMRGLFDLIASIFTHLPTAKVTNPERMIDFVQWLASMEAVNGDRAGDYQAIYSDALNQGQLDSILDNLLAAAVLEFAQEHTDGRWDGTPAELFIELNAQASKETLRSKEWPQNAIAMSKRLRPLHACLQTQGVTIEFGRGKQRTITVKSTITIKSSSPIKSNGAKNDDDNKY